MALISLSRVAGARAASEAHPLPGLEGAGLAALRAAALHCHACPLWRRATQTVFGEGPRRAPLLLIGEQPGDQEDLAGHPFVGPAGRLLDGVLAEIGLDRGRLYVTNAVKHFKWTASEGRGKRRLHEKPSTTEVSACRPWVLAEIQAVAPKVIVCLGATAAQSLLGHGFRVTRDRGRPVPSPWGQVVATVHPSSILRIPDDQERARERQRFSEDLRAAAALVRGVKV
jgi:uracil-DNA glycosylase family protein